MAEIDLEALADQIHREHIAPREAESKVRMGRPNRLSHRDEFELYCYRKSGVAIKTCAGMFRVSVPTANRIIAKFRAYDSQVEPKAREFQDMIESLRDST